MIYSRVKFIFDGIRMKEIHQFCVGCIGGRLLRISNGHWRHSKSEAPVLSDD